MTHKQKVHGSLDALIHVCAKNLKQYKSTTTIPCNELLQEIGFSKDTINGYMRIVITAEIISDEDETYERETSSSSKD